MRRHAVRAHRKAHPPSHAPPARPRPRPPPSIPPPLRSTKYDADLQALCTLLGVEYTPIPATQGSSGALHLLPDLTTAAQALVGRVQELGKEKGDSTTLLLLTKDQAGALRERCMRAEHTSLQISNAVLALMQELDLVPGPPEPASAPASAASTPAATPAKAPAAGGLVPSLRLGAAARTPRGASPAKGRAASPAPGARPSPRPGSSPRPRASPRGKSPARGGALGLPKAPEVDHEVLLDALYQLRTIALRSRELEVDLLLAFVPSSRRASALAAVAVGVGEWQKFPFFRW